MKRHMRLFALLAALMLVVAACGSDDSGSDEADDTPTTEAPATTAAPADDSSETTEAPAETDEPAEPADTGIPDDPDSGVTAEAIKIGWMGDATGPTASAQAFNLRGLEAFVDYQNTVNGGVLGRELELVVKDDQFSAETAAANFTSLVDDERVLAIAQMGGSHISTALMPEVQEVGIPVISQGQTIDIQLETESAFNNIAHYGDQADVAVQRIGDNLGSLDDANVVVIQLELPSGDEWNEYIVDSIGKQGGNYLGRILINAGGPDYPGAITQLKEFVDNDGANYIAMHGAPAHGLGVLTEMKNQGLRIPIIGIHGIAGSQIYLEGPEDMLDLAEGIHSFLPANVSTPGTDIIRDFVAGTEWEADSLQLNFSDGWLEGMIIVQAIERAAADAGAVNRVTMTEALQGTFDTMGISCPIDWSASNHSPCATPFAWNPDIQALEPVGGFDAWADALDGEYGLGG